MLSFTWARSRGRTHMRSRSLSRSLSLTNRGDKNKENTPSSPKNKENGHTEGKLKRLLSGTLGGKESKAKASPPQSPLGKLLHSPRNAKKKGQVTGWKSMLQKGRRAELLKNMVMVLTVVTVVYVFFGEGTGPHLVKRDAPLYDGNVLKGGDYITSCTGIISPFMDCEAQYFELSRDGELGLYKGTGPKDSKGKIWGSGTRGKSKQGQKDAYAATWLDGKITVKKNDQAVFKYPKDRLPKKMQGDWPLA
ncbi:unnamed protein product [Chrysoparadoxa australica]